MQHLKIFIELTRLNKPIGYMLLFWPCSWGLAYAYSVSQNEKLFIYYLILFFFGSVLMRSAGCIVNDIVDKDFDKRVKRTKRRPIASGKISIKKSLMYVIILCALAFLILIQFNFLTIALGLGSMFLAFSYPFMKRITYWPQLFLGLTFNWGIIMAWAAINNGITIEIVTLYISAIFWTLGYDTIYGAQDMRDDEIIGLKSTSIKFKSKPHLFLKLCYTIFLISLFIVGWLMQFNQFYYLGLIFVTLHLYFFQIHRLVISDAHNCLKIFKSNNVLGLIVLIALILGKF